MTRALIPKETSCRVSPPPPIPIVTIIQTSTTRNTKIYTKIYTKSTPPIAASGQNYCANHMPGATACSCAHQQPKPAGASRSQPELARTNQSPQS